MRWEDSKKNFFLKYPQRQLLEHTGSDQMLPEIWVELCSGMYETLSGKSPMAMHAGQHNFAVEDLKYIGRMLKSA